MRIGVYGGSFDPVHLGHLIIADAAADLLELDQVHFVPVFEHPVKTKSPVAGVADRVQMLRLALVGNPRFVLDTTEVERGGVSYTVDTLASLRDQFPEDQLFLMVGADAARSLSSWYQAERLPVLARLVAMSRAGDPPPDNSHIDRRIDVPSIDISATEIRRRRRAGRSIRYRVPPEVLDYIETRGLYTSEDACSKQSSLRSSAPGSTAN